MNIGGDHSIASATISAAASHYKDVGVIWVDAHADCNTPEISVSKNYHGMPLSHVLGLFREETAFSWLTQTIGMRSVVLIGIRDVDTDEQTLIDFKKIKYYTMSEVNKKGIKQVMDEAMDFIGSKKVHMSLDVDGIDPTLVPGTGTAVESGLLMQDMEHIIDRLKEKGDDFVSMDLVEVNFEIEREKTLATVNSLIQKIFS